MYIRFFFNRKRTIDLTAGTRWLLISLHSDRKMRDCATSGFRSISWECGEPFDSLWQYPIRVTCQTAITSSFYICNVSETVPMLSWTLSSFVCLIRKFGLRTAKHVCVGFAPVKLTLGNRWRFSLLCPCGISQLNLCQTWCNRKTPKTHGLTLMIYQDGSSNAPTNTNKTPISLILISLLI